MGLVQDDTAGAHVARSVTYRTVVCCPVAVVVVQVCVARDVVHAANVVIPCGRPAVEPAQRPAMAADDL